MMNKRMLLKYVEKSLWYTNINLGDKYRNEWKYRIPNKRRRRGRDYHPGQGKRNCNINRACGERKRITPTQGEERKITIAMFVPGSRDSRLLSLIKDKEDKLSGQLSWGVKVFEQSGTPLILAFATRFPIAKGCPRGNKCIIYENYGRKCAPRIVIYKATRTKCIAQQSSAAEIDPMATVRDSQESDLHEVGLHDPKSESVTSKNLTCMKQDYMIPRAQSLTSKNMTCIK